MQYKLETNKKNYKDHKQAFTNSETKTKLTQTIKIELVFRFVHKCKTKEKTKNHRQSYWTFSIIFRSFKYSLFFGFIRHSMFQFLFSNYNRQLFGLWLFTIFFKNVSVSVSTFILIVTPFFWYIKFFLQIFLIHWKPKKRSSMKYLLQTIPPKMVHIDLFSNEI